MPANENAKLLLNTSFNSKFVAGKTGIKRFSRGNILLLNTVP